MPKHSRANTPKSRHRIAQTRPLSLIKYYNQPPEQRQSAFNAKQAHPHPKLTNSINRCQPKTPPHSPRPKNRQQPRNQRIIISTHSQHNQKARHLLNNEEARSRQQSTHASTNKPRLQSNQPTTTIQLNPHNANILNIHRHIQRQNTTKPNQLITQKTA